MRVLRKKRCGRLENGMSVGVIFLLAVVALLAIMVGSCFYFSFWMQKSTFNNVNDLDDIRSTQLPPERWQRSYLKKCRKLGRVPQELFEKQKKKDLRKLKKLIRFCKTTRLMESDEVRDGVLQELNMIKQEWQAQDAPQ